MVWTLFSPLAITCVTFLTGVLAAESGLCSAPIAIGLTAVSFIVALYGMRAQRRCLATSHLLMVVFAAGVLHWHVFCRTSDSSVLRQLGREQAVTAEVSATISSLPSVHVRPVSRLSPRNYGSPLQTRFLVDVHKVLAVGTTVSIRERCRVYVEGDATHVLHCGDQVSLTGQIAWPKTPGNPGEFDFQRFLRRRGIAAVIYAHHVDAVRVVQAAPHWTPGFWLSKIRNHMQRTIVKCIDKDVQPMALALLLGDRNQLSPETQDTFIASGTMHLLAISGLHVGILFLFLLRLLNLVLVPRGRSLMIGAGICVMYALVTDLRPSVVRATVFISVMVASHFSCRRFNTTGLLAISAAIMLIWQPWLAFDVGAWLSFLSVAALAWAGRGAERADEGDRDPPVDAVTRLDRLRLRLSAAGKRLSLRYRQMLLILVLTMPLIAQQFHVMSPVGILVNVVLIPFTAALLCCGFSVLCLGLVSSTIAMVPAALFSGGLHLLLQVVRWSADLSIGHLYVSDVPDWFLPAYYLSLFVFISTGRRTVRRIALLCVLGTVLGTFSAVGAGAAVNGLRVSVLDVGHGSAAILESSHGRTILIDAGALNRATRTSDVVCRFLWHRGITSLDTILLSHADIDHFNALEGILRRIPVGEIVTSRDFVRSESSTVRAALDLMKDSQVPVRLLSHGDATAADGIVLFAVQADPAESVPKPTDNETSLALVIEYQDRRICLPGDLEGPALESALHQIGDVDLLVSPHHGSLSANTRNLADVARPEYIVVSSRDDRNAERLAAVFAKTGVVWHTANAGCVSISIDPRGDLSLESFRKGKSGH